MPSAAIFRPHSRQPSPYARRRPEVKTALYRTRSVGRSPRCMGRPEVLVDGSLEARRPGRPPGALRRGLGSEGRCQGLRCPRETEAYAAGTPEEPVPTTVGIAGVERRLQEIVGAVLTVTLDD